MPNVPLDDEGRLVEILDFLCGFASKNLPNILNMSVMVHGGCSPSRLTPSPSSPLCSTAPTPKRVSKTLARSCACWRKGWTRSRHVRSSLLLRRVRRPNCRGMWRISSRCSAHAPAPIGRSAHAFVGGSASGSPPSRPRSLRMRGLVHRWNSEGAARSCCSFDQSRPASGVNESAVKSTSRRPERPGQDGSPEGGRATAGGSAVLKIIPG
jgi:hypothetical protein